MKPYIVLVDCPDQRGLVHAVTGVLLKHGCNVVSNHEFVDRTDARFFMRTEFSGEFDAQSIQNDLKAALPEKALVHLSRGKKPNIVILATREHHCLGELLLRNAYDELGANISAIVANYNSLSTLAEKFKIPFHFVTHEGRSREDHEAAMLAHIDTYAPDYLVLAKYMRVLTPGTVTRYSGRIINIHHSFLPAFIGASPYRQAYERGVKIIGATAHFVTADLDEGPIITQSIIPVDHSHSAEDMAQAGRDVEKLVLAKALKLVFDERIFLSGKRTIIFD